MAGHSGNPTAAEAETLAGIRRAAEATLAAWPEARAAVLFGSRARGDHLPSSDWDVAFITRSGGDIDAIPDGLPIGNLPWDVQALAVPEELARRKALSLGHVGRGVARDGKLLAGGWNRPDVKGKPAMEPSGYESFAKNASIYIKVAATHAREAGDDGFHSGGEQIAAHFMARSADAAEHLAKAMLGRRGIDPDPTHDASRLANQAERAGHPELAESIRRLDGFTRTDHVAVYRSETGDPRDVIELRSQAADSLRHAIDRLPSVIEELAREIASAARDPQYAAAAFRVSRIAAAAANRLASDLRQDLERDAGEHAEIQSDEWWAPLARARPSLLSALTQMAERLRPIAEPGGGRSRDTGRSQSIFD